MTKKQALEIFKETILPLIPKDDVVAKCEEWNNFTDFLCKNREITGKQYDSWSNPF